MFKRAECFRAVLSPLFVLQPLTTRLNLDFVAQFYANWRVRFSALKILQKLLQAFSQDLTRNSCQNKYFTQVFIVSYNTMSKIEEEQFNPYYSIIVRIYVVRQTDNNSWYSWRKHKKYLGKNRNTNFTTLKKFILYGKLQINALNIDHLGHTELLY